VRRNLHRFEDAWKMFASALPRMFPIGFSGARASA
jgi:hypothetical protein